MKGASRSAVSTSAAVQSVSLEGPHLVDAREVAFKVLSPRISEGLFAGMSVFILRENGYVNATKMISSAGAITKGGKAKELSAWMKMESTSALLEAFARQYHMPKEILTIRPRGIEKEWDGTYVHFGIVPHVAIWADPDLGAVAGNIMAQYFVQKERDAVLSLREDLDAVNEEREALRADLDALAEERETLRSECERMERMRIDRERVIREKRDEVEALRSALSSSTSSLHEAEQRAAKKHTEAVEVGKRQTSIIPRGLQHTFAIFEVIADVEGSRFTSYIAVRREIRCMSMRKKELRREYSEVEMVYPSDGILAPNPIDDWNKLHEELIRKRILPMRVKGDSPFRFILLPPNTRETLVMAVDEFARRREREGISE
jgi:hypothetical protein